MPDLNAEHVNAVIQFINDGPYFRLLGMTVTNLGSGYADMVMDIKTDHMSPFDSLHGGAIASVIDSACYWAVYSECAENAGLITLDLKMDFLASRNSGRLTVSGRRIKLGKTICLAEAAAVDQDGKWIAHGSSKLLVRSDLQNPSEMMEARTDRKIPPKFLH